MRGAEMGSILPIQKSNHLPILRAPVRPTMVRNLDFPSRSHSAPDRWDQDLLLRLDWKRLYELTRAVIWTAGFKVKSAFTFADAAVDFVVSDSRSGRQIDVALVHSTPWNAIDVDAKHVRRFLRHLSLQREITRGIYITPGTFTPEAHAQALGFDVELVNGTEYLEVVARLPPSESEYLLKVATAGDFDVPSCPICHNKMVSHDTRIPALWRRLPNVTFRNSGIVSEDLCCDTLTIEEGVEVQFLRLVRCNSAIIKGGATGNITSKGTIKIDFRGSLSGLVAAKSLDVAEGAIFDGKVTVLDDPALEPLETVSERRAWICPSESCRSGIFRPRIAASAGTQPQFPVV